jgi:hypothetical protein
MCGLGRWGAGGGGGAAVEEVVDDPTEIVTLRVGGGAVERGVWVCCDPAETGGAAAVPPEREIA